MDYLSTIIGTIGAIVFLACLLILFGPIFIELHKIGRSAGSAAGVELVTYQLEEPPANFVDADFTVIVTEDQ